MRNWRWLLTPTQFHIQGQWLQIKDRSSASQLTLKAGGQRDLLIEPGRALVIDSAMLGTERLLGLSKKELIFGQRSAISRGLERDDKERTMQTMQKLVPLNLPVEARSSMISLSSASFRGWGAVPGSRVTARTKL